MKDYSIKSIRNEFKSKGVFYTPKELGEKLKSLVDIEYSNVYDPTCGRGYLLSVFDDDIKKYGQELDPQALEDAKDSLKNFIGYVGDTIKVDKFPDMKFDLIVANPPFSIKYEQTKELENDIRFKDLPTLAPAGRADYMFIAHCISKLNDKGQAIILGFPGILYRKAREYTIRKYLIEQGFIEKVIHIKGDTFVDTKIATCVLVIKKHRQDKSILFVDTENDIEHLANYEEIVENDYNLSVSTYCIKEEVKEQIDPVELERKARANVILGLKKNIKISSIISQIDDVVAKALPIDVFLNDLRNEIDNPDNLANSKDDFMEIFSNTISRGINI